jgi:hypothetical protein
MAPSRSQHSLAVTAVAVVAAVLTIGFALRACGRVAETTASKAAPVATARPAAPDDAGDEQMARGPAAPDDAGDDDAPDDAPAPRHATTDTQPQRHDPLPHARGPRADRKAKGARHPRTLFASPPEVRYATATPSEIPVDGDFSSQGGSVSLWLDPAWGAGNQDDATLVGIADGLLRLVKNVTFLRLEATDPNGHVDGVGTPIGDWQPGEWHYITIVWDSGGSLALYVDGNLASQKYVGIQMDLPPGSTMIVGSQFPPGRPAAAGTVAGVDVSARPLSPYGVGQIFDHTKPPVPPTQ